MMKVYNLVQKYKEDIINYRRYFHMFPELDMNLETTTKKIKEVLNELNVEYITTSNSGIKAILRGEKEGKTIAIRADMDALPIQEKNEVQYKSKNDGKMHACGHDAHSSILLGVIKIMSMNLEDICGTIVFLFEPSEETDGGAQKMIQEGVLENPHVDHIVGLHVSEKYEVGEVAIKSGYIHAASNPFEIVIKGKGGHGAHPEDTIDPIWIGSNLITSIQGIVSREINPKDSAVITVGSFNAGSAGNIIPSTAILKGMIRTTNTKNREFVVKRVEETANSVVKGLRGDCDIKILNGYPCLENDESLVLKFIDIAENLDYIKKVNLMDYINMGVESFSYFAKERPSIFYFLGTKNGERFNKPAHNEYFDIDEESLVVGTALQVEFVMELAKNI